MTQQCTLSATTVAPGQTLSATGSLWNNTTTALSLLEVVLAGRPPGGTNAGGPFDDFGPVSGAISVGAGATYTLRSSRTFTTSDPAGTWRCFLTYQTADSVYHDGLDTTFTVSSPAPTPTPGATPTPGPTPTPAPTPTPGPTPPPSSGAYLVVSNGNLVYNGRVVTLRGENFNNEPALACCGGPNITKINANNADYAQASTVLGENAIRFGMDWNWYNANRTQFYSVVDQHVAWAKANHLWMLPVIYEVPGASAGGYCCQDPFWNSSTNQQTLINFWIDFASHYANEPTIIGYDVINEPAPPSQSVYDGWSQRVYNAILGVDTNHLVSFEV
ncbi:MAG TPA: cellulase family glycosylhydrolase, partial [Candidatus Limnocylindria bacterium]|nr:cellulase family glycosylhydrolase [Candidatus Limnocylindria bacterium]